MLLSCSSQHGTRAMEFLLRSYASTVREIFAPRALLFLDSLTFIVIGFKYMYTLISYRQCYNLRHCAERSNDMYGWNLFFRYLVIIYPLKSKSIVTPSRVKITIVFGWMLSILLAIPQAVLQKVYVCSTNSWDIAHFVVVFYFSTLSIIIKLGTYWHNKIFLEFIWLFELELQLPQKNNGLFSRNNNAW